MNKFDIAKLYIALFNRAPEAEGLNYWIEKSNELTPQQIADAMISSASNIVKSNPTYQSIYPQYIDIDYNNINSVRAIIENIYKTLFNKDYTIDPDGIDYWSNEVVNGKDIGEVVNEIIKAADEFATGIKTTDSTTLDYALAFENKSVVALNCANKIETSDINNDGTIDFNTFKSFINGVDSSLNSVKTSLSLIDSYAISKDVTVDMLKYDELPIEIKSLITINSNNDPLKLDSAKDGIVTYSFNETFPSEYENYGINLSDLTPFNDEDKEMVRDIFNKLEEKINLKFVEVPDNGDIRFNKTETGYSEESGGETGFTLTISDGNEYTANGAGADVFIGTNLDKNLEYNTLMHDIGHALGLKHPFEGYPIMPPNEDKTTYTVMSYTIPDVMYDLDFFYDPSTNTISYKQIYLGRDDYAVFDIEALEWLYGNNPHKESNDTYNLSNLTKDKKFYVIDDDGGIDTINLSDTINNSIDLSGIVLSDVDYQSFEDVLKEKLEKVFYENDLYGKFDFDSTLEYFAENTKLYNGYFNLAISQNSIIENYIGGRGTDAVVDNYIDNEIFTEDGNDTIYLLEGDDIVDGGNGVDSVKINGNRSDYEEIKYLNNLTMLIGKNDIALYNVEDITFNDDYIV
jgi:hypothetical protein